MKYASKFLPILLRNQTGLLGILIFCLLLPACQSQRDPADVWKAKVLRAHGGAQILKQISTLFFAGKIVTRDDNGTVALYVSHPGKLRATMKYQNRSEDRILLGNRGWRDFGPGFEEVSGPSLAAMIFQYNHLNLPMGLLEQKSETAYRPRKKGDQEIPVLELTAQGQPPMTVIIDPETGLIQRVNGKITMGNHEVVMGAGYSDYRTINGVMLPFRIVNYVNGTPIAESRYDSVKVNVSLKPDTFSPPIPSKSN
jgi:hypothetical protein